MKKLGYLAAIMMGVSLICNTGCRREGAAERAGESLDGTKNHPVHDALNPDGPGEKAGKKIDHAVDKAAH
jgi:hypothetical protein